LLERPVTDASQDIGRGHEDAPHTVGVTLELVGTGQPAARTCGGLGSQSTESVDLNRVVNYGSHVIFSW